MSKGLLAVFTGNGKGKTTAALGLALRAAGHGMRIAVIQFIKGSRTCGEFAAVKRFDDLIDFHVMGRGFTWASEDIEKDRAAARTAWRLASEIIAVGARDMVILDELTYLMHHAMVDAGTILPVLVHRPARMHVIVTGRYAPPALIEAADLVTEMTEIKHPFKAGTKAQKGIEY